MANIENDRQRYQWDDSSSEEGCNNQIYIRQVCSQSVRSVLYLKRTDAMVKAINYWERPDDEQYFNPSYDLDWKLQYASKELIYVQKAKPCVSDVSCHRRM